MTANYGVNYEDERFKSLEEEEAQALKDADELYAGMEESASKFYQDQKDAVANWEAEQKASQQAQTDFAISQINQQKAQTEKDYKKEQSGAYADWQKESNRYGVNAEQMAAQGLANTGYSESSQVGMYNTYQNRVAAAREGYNRAVQNYNNNIQQARMQNNSAMAEIAYQSLQQQLSISLEEFQYGNQLVLDKADRKASIEKDFYGRYQDVLEQINYENAMEIKAAQEEAAGIDDDFPIIDKDGESGQEGAPVFVEPVGAKVDLPATEIKNGALINPVTGESFKLPFLSNTDKAVINYVNNSKKTGNVPAVLNTAKMQEAALDSVHNADVLSNGKTGVKPSVMSPSARAVLEGLDEKRLSGTPAGLTNKTVNTKYYSGEINSDAGIYGTFNNGYQPKGVSGHGTLEKTGDKIKFQTETLEGKNKTVKQNIWEAEDGTLWYWQGTENKYIQIKKDTK